MRRPKQRHVGHVKMAESESDIPASSSSSSSTTASYESSGTVSASPPSILSVLRAPKLSDLARKRRVASNPPHDGKRHKSPSCASDPKSVTPAMRVKNYPGECLVVSGGKLFCNSCREDLSVKSSVVKLHLQSAKHKDGKARLLQKTQHEHDIIEAIQQYDADNHPKGETLSMEERVYRVKCVRTFLRAGVPLSKIDIFRELLEENAFRLGSRKVMADIIPIIVRDEHEKIKKEVIGQKLTVIFDGTSRLGEALAVVIRFVDDNWSIQQRLIRLQLIAKSMTGEEVARELISILSTQYGIGSDQLLGAMRDRASVNNVAMSTLKVVYPKVLDVGCF